MKNNQVMNNPSECANEKCRAYLDMVDNADLREPDNKPTPGSISICVYCSTIAVFNHELKLILPEQETINHLMELPEILDALEKIAVIQPNLVKQRELYLKERRNLN